MKNPIIKYYMNDISVGMTATQEKMIDDADVTFAVISGDFNPIHLDDDYARNTIFGERICHGMLTASHISAALASFLPGPGWIYIEQSLYFKAPVKIGDIVRTCVRVKECIPKNNLITLTTECFVKDNIVLDGIAAARSPD